MDDILDVLMGVDKKKEIFDLWYEVTFLRHCFNSILSLNPEIHKDFDERWLQRCRELASEEVKNRFPNCKIDFSPTKTSEERKEYAEKCKEGVEEALIKFSEKLNKGYPEDLSDVKG